MKALTNVSAFLCRLDPFNFSVIEFVTLFTILILFLATLVRSTFGFGESLIAVPLLALYMPIEIAVPVSVLASVVVAGVVVSIEGMGKFTENPSGKTIDLRQHSRTNRQSKGVKGNRDSHRK